MTGDRNGPTVNLAKPRGKHGWTKGNWSTERGRGGPPRAKCIKERDGILINLDLLDAVFCVEVTFVMGDWDSRAGTERKAARLWVDEYRLFAFWIRIDPPYEGFVRLCQAR